MTVRHFPAAVCVCLAHTQQFRPPSSQHNLPPPLSPSVTSEHHSSNHICTGAYWWTRLEFILNFQCRSLLVVFDVRTGTRRSVTAKHRFWWFYVILRPVGLMLCARHFYISIVYERRVELSGLLHWPIYRLLRIRGYTKRL